MAAARWLALQFCVSSVAERAFTTAWRVPLLAGTVTIVAADEALEVLRRLVAGAVRAPDDEPPRGAEPAELVDLEARLGCGIPPVLRAWLSICRGARIGPGGVFGARPDDPSMDMAWMRDLYPQWAGSDLLPVAGDGCGNYYILAADGTVGFMDTMADPDRIDRRVANDLLSFMTSLLASEQDPGRAAS